MKDQHGWKRRERGNPRKAYKDQIDEKTNAMSHWEIKLEITPLSKIPVIHNKNYDFRIRTKLNIFSTNIFIKVETDIARHALHTGSEGMPQAVVTNEH